MKIMSNDSDLFKRVGNLFPDVSELLIATSFFPNKLQLLLGLISSGELEGIHSIKASFLIEYLSKSYQKRLSSFIKLTLQTFELGFRDDHYILGNAAYTQIGELIYSRYYFKWNKLLETFKLKYNAIRPYDMDISEDTSETTDNDVLITRTNENSSNSESKDTVINDESEDSIYGFNSNSPVPSDKSVNKSESESTNTDNFNSTGSTDSQQDKTVNSERTIKRLGNIGNITQQELIEREREVWQYQIIDVVFKDLDKIFTNGSY